MGRLRWDVKPWSSFLPHALSSSVVSGHVAFSKNTGRRGRVSLTPVSDTPAMFCSEEDAVLESHLFLKFM